MNREEKLASEIMKHKALYYNGKAEISDEKYDELENELRELNPDHSVLFLVGTPNKSNNEKIAHDKKMLSLNKTYKEEELKKWRDGKDVVSTFKIDGVSGSVIYKDGKLSLGKTRGDGSYGEDITEKTKWIQTIPKQISDTRQLEIRGEIYCDEKNFIDLSQEMGDIGLERPSSQRNITAGLLSRKENIHLCRYLKFQAFEIISDDIRFSTEVEKFEHMKSIDLNVAEYQLHKSDETIHEAINQTKKFMSDGDYLIDGLVVTYNEIALHEELGETSHHPRYKMAFKFQGETKRARIEEITWNVSRNGVITPVAKIEPTFLSGAEITNVTLHNFGMVKNFNLKKNDEIEIIRSGEVIPKFLEVINSSDEELRYPRECPSCGHETTVDDIRLKCENADCPTKIEESILHFVKKIGIDDLSSKRLAEMMNQGIVVDEADLYSLDVEDLLKLDKTKEKLANKLYESIQKTKNVGLAQFLSALGITGGGINKCEKIVENGIDSIEKILTLKKEELMAIESFAEKSAHEFVLSLEGKKPLIKKLLAKGFNFSVNSRPTGGKLTGKKICITGTLSEKRSVIENKIKDAGGQCVSSVTNNTDYLLTNDESSTSSKFKKAQKLEIEIINEKKLAELLE